MQARRAAAEGGSVTDGQRPREVGLESIDLRPEWSNPIGIKGLEQGLALEGADVGRRKEDTLSQAASEWSVRIS
jgi:hypothetical protein